MKDVEVSSALGNLQSGMDVLLCTSKETNQSKGFCAVFGLSFILLGKLFLRKNRQGEKKAPEFLVYQNLCGVTVVFLLSIQEDFLKEEIFQDL